jgi:cyclopropane fatty-acyl-phospholipid synthase-like methyltransferase
MYSDMERSHGVGGLLDRYFLDDALCRGVIRRSAHLRELLTRRLLEGQQRVLNLACGPCFEVREVAMQPELHSSQVVGVDFDQDALDFTASKLNGSRRVSWEGRRENLLRLALRGWTIQEREAFDFTYSIGLFDYLEDRALSSVLRFMREQTSTEGVVVTSFKDCDQYSPTAYDWFCDWQFVPRRLEDAKRMLCEAGIATADMHIESLDGDEIFFITFPGCRVPGSRGGHGGRARESSESGF